MLHTLNFLVSLSSSLKFSCLFGLSYITLAFFSLKSIAQERGCLISGRVYYEDRITNKYFKGSSYYTDYTGCTPGGEYFELTSQNTNNCFAFYDGSGDDETESNYLLGPGIRVRFLVYECPIDDYIIPFLGIVGLFCYRFLKKHMPIINHSPN